MIDILRNSTPVIALAIGMMLSDRHQWRRSLVGAIMANVSSVAAQLNKDTHAHGSFTDRLGIAKKRVGELHDDRLAVANALLIDIDKRLQQADHSTYVHAEQWGKVGGKWLTPPSSIRRHTDDRLARPLMAGCQPLVSVPYHQPVIPVHIIHNNAGR